MISLSVKNKIANHSRTSADKLNGGSVQVEVTLLEQSNGLDFNTYSIQATGNRILISATSQEGLSDATEMFYNLLVNVSNFKTTKNLCFPCKRSAVL